MRAVSPGEVADSPLRAGLSEEIPYYTGRALNADEFDSIGYYNLDRDEIADTVIARLRDLLPVAQLGTVAELHERAVKENALRPTLLSIAGLRTVALCMGLLLLVGSTLSLLLTGIKVETAPVLVLLVIAGGYAIRSGPKIIRQFVNARRGSADASQRYDEAVIEQMVSPVIREVINDRLYHYGSRLTVRSSPGLLADDPLFWIDTGNSRRLLNLMAVMPSGSIGLAGPRGCGKTTLLKALCTDKLRLPRGQMPEAVLVTAPIEFASRDFLLYLFAQICQQYLRHARLRNSLLTAERQDTIQGGRGAGLVRRHLGKATLLAVLCLIASPFVAYAALPTSRQIVVWQWLRVRLAMLFGKNQTRVFTDTGQVWHFLQSLDKRLAVISVIMFLAGLIFLLIAAKRLASWLLSLTVQDNETEQLARRHLRNIRFQQSYSYGWSGSLTVPMAQVGINEAFSLAEYQQSLPDIVAAMREFLEHIATKTRPVIIAVDELDKVASDVTAAQFLNDLKGIFGVRHCFYLVSVSEEALSNFELRGFPFRDAFESAFDEVLYLRPLIYPEARRLLQRRVVGLSAAYLCLCQCLAGGLPRDLIRVARDLVETRRGTGPAAQRQIGMCDVVAALVQLDIQGRADAAMIALRRTSTKLEIEPMALWINQISGRLAGWQAARDSDSRLLTSELRAQELLELCGSYPAAVYHDKTADTKAGGDEGEASTVSRLGLGLAGSLYYLATVIELFRDSRTKAEFQNLDGSVADTTKTRQIDYLTRARQAFTVSPMIAWKQISAFRASWSMIVLDPPGRQRQYPLAIEGSNDPPSNDYDLPVARRSM